jgi:hypothetical protein
VSRLGLAVRRLPAGLRTLVSYVVAGVVGNWAFESMKTLDPTPLRDVVLVLIWPLAIIAGTVVAVAWLRQAHAVPSEPPKAERELQPAGPTVVLPRPARVVPPAPPKLSPPPQAELTDVTPDELWSLFKGRMDIEAEPEVALFVGKRMTVTGPLGDIGLIGSISDRRSAQVTFVSGAYEHLIFMMFQHDWLERLRPISQGTRITVRGTIDRVSAIDILLRGCEIVRLGP